MKDDDKLAQSVNYGDLALDANGDIAPGDGAPWYLAAAIVGLAGKRKEHENIVHFERKLDAVDAAAFLRDDWVFRQGAVVYAREVHDLHEGVPVPSREHREHAALAAYFERVDFDPERCGRAAGRLEARRAKRGRP